MSYFHFYLAVIGFFILAVSLMVISHYATMMRFNNFLRNQMEKDGYQVVRISSTEKKFHAREPINESKILIGGPFIKNASSGSGTHFRKVEILHNGHEVEILAAIKVQFFQPVGYHLSPL